MNKPMYLGMPILDISKTLMYEFWYYYVKPKYRDKAKLCYMDTDSPFIRIKAKDFYEDVVNIVEKWLCKSNYSKDDKRLLPIGINKKVISLFKVELGREIMTEFVALSKSKSITDDDSKHKKAK